MGQVKKVARTLKESTVPQATPRTRTVEDLVETALAREPGEFGQAFGELMRDRLAEAVSQRKRAIAEILLGGSKEPETEEDKQEEADLETETDESVGGDGNCSGIPDEKGRVRENDGRKAAKHARLWKPKIVKPTTESAEHVDEGEHKQVPTRAKSGLPTAGQGRNRSKRKQILAKMRDEKKKKDCE